MLCFAADMLCVLWTQSGTDHGTVGLPPPPVGSSRGIKRSVGTSFTRKTNEIMNMVLGYWEMLGHRFDVSTLVY